MCAGRVPRRNWKRFSPDGMEKTRITVPFSDAVARRVPSLLRARQPMVDWWAWIVFTASRVVASKIRTSPAFWGAE
jgi:hypothetical protein